MKKNELKIYQNLKILYAIIVTKIEFSLNYNPIYNINVEFLRSLMARFATNARIVEYNRFNQIFVTK